ncbi:DUF4352 domain-containing protein [Actinacidiphila bryophytorum]|uniref:DUF4352 domain-containing protein n=1 Tax=Actinacidiphila bryophytorum TaxID=1436133 RepID=A0A9W4H8H6_9ACTN|nr:DUF4352 domain-containing protein [Actinacidiphila bryophytorum]MBM9438305.1 DUF4352 domain-containing protein [Actinacidiphila bryophytorum]MBN6545756.1 DUF4352 domain-containing protein [Actinacidiphila bryophytorum]CAG7657954.1 conserved exported hypothetical protein [Actinacidiphila bryophytorum]
MRSLAGIGLAALLVTTAVGCAGNPEAAGTPSSTPPQGSASSGPKSPIAAASHSPVPVGHTLSLTGINAGEKLDVTVVKVVDPAHGTDLSSPPPGKRLVAVQFRLHNTGSTTYNDSPANGAKVVDTQGQGFDSAITDTTSAGPNFPATTTISPGGKALGFIVFEVPAGSKVAMVQFALDSGFSTDVAQWKVH